jgi:hypothetical protein
MSKAPPARPHFVETPDVRAWLREAPTMSEYLHTIGSRRPDPHYLEDNLGLPFHLRFVLEHLTDEHLEPVGSGDLPPDTLASIPFYSLCKGLLLPLSGLSPERVGAIFGVAVAPPPDAAGREQLVEKLFGLECGLSLVQKMACVLGDPFRGRKSTFRRDSLIRLLQSMQLTPRRVTLDRLAQVGDVAILFAENRSELTVEPQLTAAEVLETLRFLPDARRTVKFDILRSLIARCGKLEA